MRTLLGILAMLPIAAHAAECSVRSGPKIVPLIELYTSEGCSSCPPADRWISGLGKQVRQGEIVALAFHVNYWDDLGWKDVYADARYTQRQRDMAAAAGAGYVYTPQVVVGGRDFQRWRSGGSTHTALEDIQRKLAPVTIEVVVRVAADRTITADVDAAAATTLSRSDLALVTVVSQDGLGSKVTAGENRGESLKHDFVVRDVALHRGLGKASATFKPRADWNLERMSVAAFAQNVRTGEVLQAVSLPLCR